MIPLWLRNRWGLAAGAATALVLMFGAWAAIGPGDAELKALVANLTFIPLGFFAAVAAFRVAVAPAFRARLRHAWLLLGLAVFASFLGDLAWAVMESWLGLPVAEQPYSLADTAYLAFYPLGVLGLARLPAMPLRPGERLRFWLDLLIVVTAAWMIVWPVVIGPAARASLGWLGQAVAVAYPVGDLVMLGAVLSLLFRRPDPASRAPLMLLMASITAFVVADLAYAYASVALTYESGGGRDIGLIAGYVLFALAAIRQQASSDAPVARRPEPGTSRLSLVLPFVAIACGFGYLLATVADSGAGLRLGAELFGGACLTVLVIARQTVALRENMRLNRELSRQYGLLEAEQEKSERLLLNILPAPIAERLKGGEGTIADHFAEVTVLFADIVGFTVLSARCPPKQLVMLLDDIFSEFDALAERHGLEKIKTIGDAYMAVSGLPDPDPRHAEAAARMALDMQAVASRFRGRQEAGQEAPLEVRIGLHLGPVIAGVIGRRKFVYDLWGDTVNLASRMESHGAPGRIQVTAAVHETLRDAFVFERRGLIEVKGKGNVPAYFLVGRRQPDPVQDRTAAVFLADGDD